MSDNTRLAKNTILMYVRMLFIVVISLYTSRIVLQNLGITDFGLYSVVGSVAVSLSFLNSAMNSSSQRFISIAIGKGDKDYIRKVFNTSRVIHAAIGFLIVLLCELVGLWFITYKMVIPAGRESAVFWSFQLSLVAAFYTMISVPYNALIISHERMGAFAYISVFEILMKLFVAYVISIIHFDRLIIYALLIALSQIIIRSIYRLYCHRHFEESKFKFYKIDELYKEMTSFASWGLIGHFSVIVNTSIQDMMLNTFFSPVVNAARGIAMRVSGVVEKFNGNFQMAVSPQITKSWAVGEKDRVFTLIFNSSRFSIYLEWILSLPIILCMDRILGLWLVEVPQYSGLFLTIVLINSVVNSARNPLNMAIRANGIIKRPAVIGGFILLLNLPLAYMALTIGFGPESVFVIMICCNILAQLSRVYFSHKYLGMSVPLYFQKVVFRPGFVLFLSAIIPYWACLSLKIVNSFAYISIIALVCVLSVATTVYLTGLDSAERQYVMKVIKKRLGV